MCAEAASPRAAFLAALPARSWCASNAQVHAWTEAVCGLLATTRPRTCSGSVQPRVGALDHFTVGPSLGLRFPQNSLQRSNQARESASAARLARIGDPHRPSGSQPGGSPGPVVPCTDQLTGLCGRAAAASAKLSPGVFSCGLAMSPAACSSRDGTSRVRSDRRVALSRRVQPRRLLPATGS